MTEGVLQLRKSDRGSIAVKKCGRGSIGRRGVIVVAGEEWAEE